MAAVRMARTADVPWMLQAIGEDAWQQLSQRERGEWTPAAMARQAQSMVLQALRSGGTAVVAEVGGRPAGAVVLGFAPPELHILAIWVDPAQRGQGVGAALIETACRLGVTLGLRLARGQIVAHNQASQALARKMGFQVERLQVVRSLQ